MPQILESCEHGGKYEICGQLMCPKCYHDDLINNPPPPTNLGARNKPKIEFIVDKHTGQLLKVHNDGQN